MILTTHAIIGAAAASMFPEHPVIAFGAAFASHFVLDAIPHWHYRVASMQKNPDDKMKDDMVVGPQFIFDVAKIGLDALLGIGISLGALSWYLHSSPWLILIGAIGGILPDPLQFVYWKFRREPIATLQRFHVRIHATTDLDSRLLLGIGSQILIAALALLFVKLAAG
jgi:hypothetical protein